MHHTSSEVNCELCNAWQPCENGWNALEQCSNGNRWLQKIIVCTVVAFAFWICIIEKLVKIKDYMMCVCVSAKKGRNTMKMGDRTMSNIQKRPILFATFRD